VACTNEPYPELSSFGGQWMGAYDASGNLTCRAPSSSTTCSGTQTGTQLTDDNEGRLTAWQSAPSSPSTYTKDLYDGEGTRSVVVIPHITLMRQAMRLTFRRALLIATISSAVMLACLWPSGILFYHLDPLRSFPIALWWAGVVFIGMLTSLWFAYGPFSRR
jgi:hypothetical protein